MSVPLTRSTTPSTHAPIADYDSNGYDYRGYWAGRDYERDAEAAVLRRLVRGLPSCEWLVDLGGGYGRNAEHYRVIANRAVLVDYSVNNLEIAAELHGWDVLAGRLYLVRADVHSLPFRDGAFDVGLAVRLLHHLADLDIALPEMLRTIAGSAVLDVPIKHHVLARARAALRRDAGALAGPAPAVNGETDHPFSAFSLQAVRRQLTELGWRAEIAASVNNFRRWDQVLPESVVTVLRPVVAILERAAQRAGRGWWGPNQFLLAERVAPGQRCIEPPPPRIDEHLGPLAARMWCPSCHGGLAWTPDAAACSGCRLRYPRRGAYWDFAL